MNQQVHDDDLKERLLVTMKTLHRTCGHWLTVSMVANAAAMNYETAKRLIISMMTEGWLNARDPDKSTQWLLIQLRPEYR